ncbi:ABC transporter substrate-binding protein [Isoptericola cucumis]|uniref:Arabinose-binding protein n=1 Tax=Isoptericola cucumis TaxID=1776856 RepID=A0ABQ2B613_9MICO|nr:extracellular solute-binding protein [Isoptericola cucumis]GGI08888.1 putative arabinose-binding protein [Isoptericola cucumis]
MSKLRNSTAALAAATAVSVLAACSGGGQSAEPTTNADGSTTLNMWTFADVHAAYYEEMAAQWNEANPDKEIQLEVTVYPYDDMHNKLQLAFNSGEGLPDVVDIEVNKFANFVKGETPPLLDLTDAAEPYVDDVVQARLDLYSKDGRVYGFPTHVGAFVAFYNTELLEGAGIDYTTIETWDDFQEAGSKYHAATDKAFGVASTSVNFLEPLVTAQLGGQFFDAEGNVQVDSPEVVEAVSMIQEMQDAGAVSTIPGGSPDSEEAFGAINDGKYAAIVYPAWYTSRYVDYMPDLAGKVAIAPAPVQDGAQVRTIGGGGTGTSVPVASPNQDLASEWLAFAKLSPEANVAVWEELGFDPVNMAVWEDEEVTKNPENKFNKYFQTNLFDVLNEVKDGIGHLESFSDPSWPTVDNTFTTVTLNDVYENGVPAPDALAKAQSSLQNELGQ